MATRHGLRVNLLRERHQALDNEIDEINERRWLSTSDNVRLKSMKVKRLRLRDQIHALEQELMPMINSM
jgi:hypothetical protein|tara:strand:+ start:61 stop:267 length:207 start_codon:yes stop_codon:yes gene_type:complete